MLTLIVEGWSDYDRLREVYPKLDAIVTNGTKINNRLRASIDKRVEKGYEIYILSDPDEAGKHLANMIKAEYPSFPRIVVAPEKATYFTGKRIKYGIEYMSHESIKELLGGFICESQT